jgi:serine protease AprX
MVYHHARKLIAILLVLLLGGSVNAGITVTGADGITATGGDGVTYVQTSGITATGVDGFLALAPNGITATGVDGITATGVDGITATGVDGVTYTGANGITATGVDSATLTRADGITATGVDGITITGVDGTSYRADSVNVRQANGITATGVDGITATGVDGITATGVDSRQFAHSDGITATGVDGLTINGSDGITATGVDGRVFQISPNGITITGVDGITATGVDGAAIKGADDITATGQDALAALGLDVQLPGLRSVDPELAVQLDRMTDDSNVNAIVVYHQLPTDGDLADLQRIGVTGGTRYRALPMIALTARRDQLLAISHLVSVRSIYGNRTLQTTSDPYMSMTGSGRVRSDAELSSRNSGTPMTGRGVTVAVLDTGVDGTHADLAGRVVQNVKLADAQSASVGFTEPLNVENMQNTDQAYGHGTFVAGVIAGDGTRSNGKFGGVAPGARVVGLSAGDLNLSYVLAGFDYLLGRGASLNVRVVNCSFSANTLFDFNDPVNVATKLLTERGINVVFSAGNTGPGQNTLNPYAVAPWVVSVGATDERGRLAAFSSRGDFGSPLFRPALVAPGVNVASTRSGALNLTGTLGVAAGADTKRLTINELPYYTTASGTSFSAPQVAGTIALMLEANPQLTPAEVRDILQRTATPLAGYYDHEVGAGMLNVHAAVLEAAFPQRRMGIFRSTLDQGQVRFVKEPAQLFESVARSGGFDTSFSIPENALQASVQIAWGPMWSTGDLGLTLFDASNTARAESNAINLPGLTGKRERVALKLPAQGVWRAHVANTLGLAAAPQPFSGMIEITRAQYRRLVDVEGLSPLAREEIYRAIRSFVMIPDGVHFRPESGVTRSELAAAMVLGGRVPQYLPGKPSYTDLRNSVTRLFVESVQAAPGGALFPEAVRGGQFRPDERASRLAAAVALVRAAGLQADADAQKLQPLGVSDAGAIPAELRGYVSVALARGLLTADGGSFRPQDSLSRAELAHAMAALMRLAMG